MNLKNRTDYRKVKKVSRAGYSFASKAEARLFDYLKLREKAGEISDLKTQPQVYLTKARILFKPDFSFTENGKTVYAEMKGFETAIWRIKRRLWKAGYGPGRLQVFRPRKHDVWMSDEIIPLEEIQDESIIDFVDVMR